MQRQQGANCLFRPVASGGANVQCQVLEPVRVQPESYQSDRARIDWVYSVTFMIEDVGIAVTVADEIDFQEGVYSGQTWKVTDIPQDAIVPPTISVMVQPK